MEACRHQPDLSVDPGTGKQIQRSISGKTQKEVAQKLKAVTAAIDAGVYTAPSKMTVKDWLDIWTAAACQVRPGNGARHDGGCGFVCRRGSRPVGWRIYGRQITSQA